MVARGKFAFDAGLSPDAREANILVSNFSDPGPEALLRWKGFAWTGGVTAEIRTIDAESDFSTPREVVLGEATSLRLNLKAPTIALIHLRPTKGPADTTSLSVISPGNRLVFQRGIDGSAVIPIAGACSWAGAAVEARLIDPIKGQPEPWTSLGTVEADHTYHGRLPASAGWYSLDVRCHHGEEIATATVERVGIGEVFVVVGHSVAHGGSINLPGAEDDRVSTIALPQGDMESQRQYKFTGDPRFLPPLVGTAFRTEIQPAPAGNGTYFWAAFGEHVARSQNVPVLLLNAAFGGTSLEHWAKSARGEPFAHPFVNSSIRMPYIRLQHALTKYCAVTGLRAILADQGQNDWPEKDENIIFANYQAWINQARKDAGFPDLAIVINRQSPPDGFGQIRRVQQRMIQEHPHCFAGPDYDTLEKDDTVDRVHLSEAGARKAAQLWADSLDANFFQKATPWLPK